MSIMELLPQERRKYGSEIDISILLREKLTVQLLPDTKTFIQNEYFKNLSSDAKILYGLMLD